MNTLVFLVVSGLMSASIAFAEPSVPNVSVTGIPTDGDATTITIHKGDKRHSLEPDYELTNGSEEISGDPVAGLKESYDAWKAACAEWKKDMREMNGTSLITLSCGTPHPDRDKTSRVTQTSTGTYKLKVRIRDPQPVH